MLSNIENLLWMPPKLKNITNDTIPNCNKHHADIDNILRKQAKSKWFKYDPNWHGLNKILHGPMSYIYYLRSTLLLYFTTQPSMSTWDWHRRHAHEQQHQKMEGNVLIVGAFYWCLKSFLLVIFIPKLYYSSFFFTILNFWFTWNIKID
jgi:hypothetical protein